MHKLGQQHIDRDMVEIRRKLRYGLVLAELLMEGHLEVRTGSDASQINFTNVENDGGFLTSTSASESIISGGMEYDGTSWYARHTSAGAYQTVTGAHYWYGDTGLTDGNTFTPTQIMSLSAAGILLLKDGGNIQTGTTTGTEIGTAANQKLGFFGATPVVQPTEITDELTTITHTAPGTPDYALQDLIDSGAGSAFGFATKDEGNSALAVIANLQARVNELEATLSSLGLLVDAD